MKYFYKKFEFRAGPINLISDFFFVWVGLPLVLVLVLVATATFHEFIDFIDFNFI